MSSTFSSGRIKLEKPAVGDYVDTWAPVVNANSDATDACFSATTSISVTSGITTMTQPQMRCQRLVVTGNLSGNATVNFFAGVAGFYVCSSSVTANGFLVTLGQNAGSTVTLPAGSLHTLVYVDGTNVVAANAGAATPAVPPGALQDFAMSTAPSGWLVCDGSAVSRATYSALFANIGTVWGSGNGSSTFNLPNLYGQFRRTWDQGGSIDPARAFASSQGDALGSHGHSITDPGHSHDVQGAQDLLTANGTLFVTSAAVATKATTINTTGITVNSTGGTETRPRNIAVLTCIKT